MKNAPMVYIRASVAYWIWNGLKATSAVANKAARGLSLNAVLTNSHAAQIVPTLKNTLKTAMPITNLQEHNAKTSKRHNKQVDAHLNQSCTSFHPTDI